MPIFRLLPAVLFFLGLAACQAARPAAPASIAETDSPAIAAKLTAEFARLKKEGQLVPLAVLRGQLARKSCALDLPTAGGGAPMALPALYRQAREGVMMVGGAATCGEPHCHQTHVNPASGYMITATGVMVTNYHVMAEHPDPTGKHVEYPDGAIAADCHGQVYPIVEVLAADQEADIAIVRLGCANGASFHPLALRPNAEIGEAISIISHPEFHFYMLSTGIITQYLADARRQTPPHAMCVSAEYGGGSSGAPVLDSCGRVVGMVSSTHTVFGSPARTQMVVRNCVPAAAILRLIGVPAGR